MSKQTDKLKKNATKPLKDTKGSLGKTVNVSSPEDEASEELKKPAQETSGEIITDEIGEILGYVQVEIKAALDREKAIAMAKKARRKLREQQEKADAAAHQAQVRGAEAVDEATAKARAAAQRARAIAQAASVNIQKDVQKPKAKSTEDSSKQNNADSN